LEITVPAVLCEAQRLDEIFRMFQGMKRSGYNRLSEAKQQREVESILLERCGVENLLWRRNAIIS
jgi:pentatricopeptide repeat protein